MGPIFRDTVSQHQPTAALQRRRYQRRIPTPLGGLGTGVGQQRRPFHARHRAALPLFALRQNSVAKFQRSQIVQKLSQLLVHLLLKGVSSQPLGTTPENLPLFQNGYSVSTGYCLIFLYQLNYLIFQFSTVFLCLLTQIWQFKRLHISFKKCFLVQLCIW